MADHEEPDVQRRLDAIEDALADLRKARGAPERAEARRDLREAKDDLEETLRKHGYHFSRADLDRLAEDAEYDRFRGFADRYAQELEAEAERIGPPAAEPEEETDGKVKPKKRAAKKPLADDEIEAEKDEEEEWV